MRSAIPVPPLYVSGRPPRLTLSHKTVGQPLEPATNPAIPNLRRNTASPKPSSFTKTWVFDQTLKKLWVCQQHSQKENILRKRMLLLSKSATSDCACSIFCTRERESCTRSATQTLTHCDCACSIFFFSTTQLSPKLNQVNVLVPLSHQVTIY